LVRDPAAGLARRHGRFGRRRPQPGRALRHRRLRDPAAGTSPPAPSRPCWPRPARRPSWAPRSASRWRAGRSRSC
jgi:hypothetical protein